MYNGNVKQVEGKKITRNQSVENQDFSFWLILMKE